MEQRYRTSALLLALALGACGETATSNNVAVAVNEDVGMEENFGASDNQQNAGSNASEPVVAQAVCAQPPASGVRLAGRRLSGRGHVLEIRNGVDGDAIIKVRDADSGRLVTSFFAARNSTATLTGIPDGNYTIQYALGSTLAEDCKSFVTLTATNEFPGPEAMVTERIPESGGTRIRTGHLTYTLYPIDGGNTVPTPIDPSAFNRD